MPQRAAYTPASVAAQINYPHDRFEAVRPAFDALGGKIIVGCYPSGEHDMLVIVEVPDDTTAAGSALVVIAGGAVRSASPPGCWPGRNGSSPRERRSSLNTAQPASVSIQGCSRLAVSGCDFDGR